MFENNFIQLFPASRLKKKSNGSVQMLSKI